MATYDIDTNTYSDGFSTTFWQDFSIADGTYQLKLDCEKRCLKFTNVRPNKEKSKMKISAIKDTFNRAFVEWRNNYRYLTDLVIQLNHKIWQWYEIDTEVAEMYNELWEQADNYACNHLKENELEYFFKITD